MNVLRIREQNDSEQASRPTEYICMQKGGKWATVIKEKLTDEVSQASTEEWTAMNQNQLQ